MNPPTNESSHKYWLILGETIVHRDSNLICDDILIIYETKGKTWQKITFNVKNILIFIIILPPCINNETALGPGLLLFSVKSGRGGILKMAINYWSNLTGGEKRKFTNFTGTP